MDIRVYTSRREESLFKLFKEISTGFIEGRELAWRLFVRDRKASYQKSFLGLFWIFVPPLATASIWMFLKGQRVIAIQNTPMAYAGFVICGTMLWGMFAEAILKPMTRFQGAMSMMAKLNFPREAIVLASFYDMFSSFLLRLLILIPALWFLGYPPTWYFLPAVFAIFGLSLAGFAIGIFLSPIGLLYGDVSKGLSVALPFAMYLTPVIYPLRATGYLTYFQNFNPVTSFLERARSLMGNYPFTMHQELLWWSVALLFMLLAGLLALKIALPIIVERSGS